MTLMTEIWFTDTQCGCFIARVLQGRIQDFREGKRQPIIRPNFSENFIEMKKLQC